MIQAKSGSLTATYKVYGILSDGLFKIRNKGSYLYATAEDTASAVMQQDDSVLQSDPNTAKRQMWHFQYIGSGRYLIRSRLNPTMALSPVSGNTSKVGITYVGEGTSAPSNTYWKITGTEASFTVKNVYYTDKVLSSLAGSYSSYANSQLIMESYKADSTPQLWTRSAVTDGGSGILLLRMSSSAVEINDNPTSYTMNVGESIQFRASYYSPTNFSQNFTWTSSNTNVATVSSDGKITAIGSGTATVKVRHAESGFERSIKIISNNIQYVNDATSYYAAMNDKIIGDAVLSGYCDI